MIDWVKSRSVFETLNSNELWKCGMLSALCRRVIHHTVKHEAVFAAEAILLSEWVEMHKIRGRNIGTACLVKSLRQIVWYPPFSSSSCGTQVLIFKVEEWQLKLLPFLSSFKARSAHDWNYKERFKFHLWTLFLSNFLHQRVSSCGWVNKYCFIHSLVSCIVNLSRSLILHNGIRAEEETGFYCCLCNLSPMFGSFSLNISILVLSFLLTVYVCCPLLGVLT